MAEVVPADALGKSAIEYYEDFHKTLCNKLNVLAQQGEDCNGTHLEGVFSEITADVFQFAEAYFENDFHGMKKWVGCPSVPSSGDDVLHIGKETSFMKLYRSGVKTGTVDDLTKTGVSSLGSVALSVKNCGLQLNSHLIKMAVLVKQLGKPEIMRQFMNFKDALKFYQKIKWDRKTVDFGVVFRRATMVIDIALHQLKSQDVANPNPTPFNFSVALSDLISQIATLEFFLSFPILQLDYISADSEICLDWLQNKIADMDDKWSNLEKNLLDTYFMLYADFSDELKETVTFVETVEEITEDIWDDIRYFG